MLDESANRGKYIYAHICRLRWDRSDDLTSWSNSHFRLFEIASVSTIVAESSVDDEPANSGRKEEHKSVSSGVMIKRVNDHLEDLSGDDEDGKTHC